MKRILKKLKRNFQDYGLAVTLKKVYSSILQVFFESISYRIYRIRLNGFAGKKLDPGGFEFRLLGPEEDEFIEQIEAMEEWLHGKVRKKLESGSVCLVALDGDQVAGFNLVSFGKVYMPLVKMARRFRQNEAWSEQITVGKAYRGRGLASTLRYAVFKILKTRGIKKFYGGTLPGNLPNRKLSRKVGFQEIGDIRYRRFFKKRSWTFNRIRNLDETL